jgi:hypothetical protein
LWGINQRAVVAAVVFIVERCMYLERKSISTLKMSKKTKQNFTLQKIRNGQNEARPILCVCGRVSVMREKLKKKCCDRFYRVPWCHSQCALSGAQNLPREE